MGWTVRGSNPVGGEIFRTRPDPPWGLPSLLFNGYLVFSEGKAAGVWRWPPIPSSAEVKERVELYFYSPYRPSWSILGRTLLLQLPYTDRWSKSRSEFGVCLCLFLFRLSSIDSGVNPKLKDPCQLSLGCIVWPVKSELKEVGGRK
jgi:hypothetical protein